MDHSILTRIKKDVLSKTIVEGEDGVKLGIRDIYTDPDLFELEMTEIFERGWVYVAHETQIQKKNDYLTTTVGRQPVVVIRGKDGQIRAFLNVCAHRGAKVCREKVGNKKILMCGFHGWCYNGKGELVNVTDEEAGAYPEGFNREKLGLTPVARIEIYRGFIFVALSDDVEPLQDYLGGSTTFIDLLVNQAGEAGLTVLPGEASYTTDANWKLVVENGLDGYHVGTVHGNYVMTTKRRAEIANEHSAEQGARKATKNLDVSNWGGDESGFYAFRNGHGVLYAPYPNHQDRPAYEKYDEYAAEFGATYADWITKKVRNLMLMPNVFLMDQMSSQIRIVRPIAVDFTEVQTFCIAPANESPGARAKRIRQYEDFFNATGMATPDDLAEFRNCQTGYKARSTPWNELSRGQKRLQQGTNELGREIGVEAMTSGSEAADEGIYLAILSEWSRKLSGAIDRELGGSDDG